MKNYVLLHYGSFRAAIINSSNNGLLIDLCTTFSKRSIKVTSTGNMRSY